MLFPIPSLTLEEVFPPTSLTVIYSWIKGLLWSWAIKSNKVLVWWGLFQPFLVPLTISFIASVVYLGKPPFQQLCNTYPFSLNNKNYIHWPFIQSFIKSNIHTYRVCYSLLANIVIFTNWGKQGCYSEFREICVFVIRETDPPKSRSMKRIRPCIGRDTCRHVPRFREWHFDSFESLC